ncbi:MAG: Nif3-like dinuclear metal center hexameric protein [Dermatophilaceae bacterium]
MSLLLREVVAALERLYPPESAMSWDRVGLVTGDLDQPVRLVHLAVDPTIAVIEQAVAAGADLLVTHHPLLLRGVHSVATTSAKGYAVTRAVVADLAVYCAHTNADVADPGVADALAQACGLGQTTALTAEEGAPLGRVGTLPEPLSLRSFAARLADALPATAAGIRVGGDLDATVRRVAVLGGAGDALFAAVRAAGADVYVTADLRHHPASEAREESRGGPPYLVDAGHWASEWPWLASARDRLLRALGEGGHDAGSVDIWISTLCTDPWDLVVGANARGGVPC